MHIAVQTLAHVRLLILAIHPATMLTLPHGERLGRGVMAADMEAAGKESREGRRMRGRSYGAPRRFAVLT
jgi:hypothetical protein